MTSTLNLPRGARLDPGVSGRDEPKAAEKSGETCGVPRTLTRYHIPSCCIRHHMSCMYHAFMINGCVASCDVASKPWD